MTVENFDVSATIERVKEQLKKEQEMSETMRSLVEMLLMIVTLLVNKLGLNSRNSSKPPSSDPNRKKNSKATEGKKRGAQPGHKGTTLRPVDDPDQIEVLTLDQATLPRGVYKPVGYESRQVFDIQITRTVTEYRAEILQDENGRRFVAPFPDGVTQSVQYGAGVKAHAVYMSMYQLIPYGRVADYFAQQMDFPISAGTLVNFNQSAYDALEQFEALAKQQLIQATIAHADETGVNVDGKRRWLHCISNDLWTLLFPHEKRGSEAIDAFGVIPGFEGVLVHDHWKPYYKYSCLHALCNAHHLRELACASEQYHQKWAAEMIDHLTAINSRKIELGGNIPQSEQDDFLAKYREILSRAEVESPPPERKEGQRGRIKKSKPRNLLERLRDYEDDTLRFMTAPEIPFTNNQGERDLRMSKVQQKISGSFRSMKGAEIFCRIRSYLSTCQKQNIPPTTALELLFCGKLPDFSR